eukprot:gene6866-11028_t
MNTELFDGADSIDEFMINLKKSVSGSLKNGYDADIGYYIGITSSGVGIKKRWSQKYEKKGQDTMKVLVQTSFKGLNCQIEEILIDYYKDNDSFPGCKNDLYSGSCPGKAPYYVYLAYKKK